VAYLNPHNMPANSSGFRQSRRMCLGNPQGHRRARQLDRLQGIDGLGALGLGDSGGEPFADGYSNPLAPGGEFFVEDKDADWSRLVVDLVNGVGRAALAAYIAAQKAKGASDDEAELAARRAASRAEAVRVGQAPMPAGAGNTTLIIAGGVAFALIALLVTLRK